MSTALLNLLFAQTIYKYAADGELPESADSGTTEDGAPPNQFKTLAEELKNHPLNSNFHLSPQACQSLYNALLPNTPGRPTVDMLEPLLAKLFESYKRDVSQQIKREEQEYLFRQKEMEDIKRGKWDSNLMKDHESDRRNSSSGSSANASQQQQLQQLRLQKQLELQQKQEQERKIQFQKQALQKQKQLERQQMLIKQEQKEKLERVRQMKDKEGSVEPTMKDVRVDISERNSSVEQSESVPPSDSVEVESAKEKAEDENDSSPEGKEASAKSSPRPKSRRQLRNSKHSEPEVEIVTENDAKAEAGSEPEPEPEPEHEALHESEHEAEHEPEHEPEVESQPEPVSEPTPEKTVPEPETEMSTAEPVTETKDETAEDEEEEEEAEDGDAEEDVSGDDTEDEKKTRPSLKRKRRSVSPGFKRFQQVTTPLLSDIFSNKSASFFAHPVNANGAPNYYNLIKSPTDLRTIKAMVRTGDIRNSAELERELQKMFANSIMYNDWGSDVSLLAREMQKETDTLLTLFRGAERGSTPVGGDDERKRRKK